MQIKRIYIQNFKSIRELTLNDMESALIIVGKNSTGKTVILDAIRAVTGHYEFKETDFYASTGNIKIGITLELTTEDLKLFHSRGVVSKYKRFELWNAEFKKRLPSYEDGLISFEISVNRKLEVKYQDGFSKNNVYIQKILPKVYYIDNSRRIEEIQKDIFFAQGKEELMTLKSSTCMFDSTKKCTNCFLCIGKIEQKMASELTITETTKLLQYRLYHLKMDSFIENLNTYFKRNSERNESIRFEMNVNANELFSMNTYCVNEERRMEGDIQTMSAGMKSIYILSLLEAYIKSQESIPCIIMMEDPESYLHPQLQKNASEILYRLSKKNQVIFSTHSPTLLFNFNRGQIRQIMMNAEGETIVNENAALDGILNDLGYSANDLMNVSFVFLVEGKQDSARLPIILAKYFPNLATKDQNLNRVAFISTNSCTNIKTYANLKYINRLYIKDSFLMVRDGDGKDKNELSAKLCGYYENAWNFERGMLPRVTRKNVLVLKYYSLENYFLEPELMVKAGVIHSVDEFFTILYEKFKEYLFRLSSVKHMSEVTGIEIKSKQDLITYFEQIRIYVRGHNLFDIYYGKYHKEALNDVLLRYVDASTRDTFADILDAVERFVFFENNRRES